MATPDFAGSDYRPDLDHARLAGQIRRVHDAMADGTWRTLREISAITGDGEASVSAQLRHLKRSINGGFQVEKRRRGEPTRGCWEYQLRPPVASDRLF